MAPISQSSQDDRLQRAVKAVMHLRAKNDELTRQTREPIAVVSMSCRLPGGVNTPDRLWELLKSGGDVVGPFPQRWTGLDLFDPDPEAVGKSYACEGGFLEGLEHFDADLFGIAPREATMMDPQQRVMLETAREALERAHMAGSHSADVRVGVYIGAMRSDYGTGQVPMDTLDGYHGTGISGSVISGRIAYALDLIGAAMTIDTACSSSLVAIHSAIAALRAGECDAALAGGVTVMCSPTMFVESSRLGAMSPDGRSKSFSASADGGGWAEGCGVVLLKRLSVAAKAGDNILGLISGSAVNQDGRSAGLTVPHGPSQTAVIRAALSAADLGPDDIDAIDAHGTGTRLGDPIEANALANVFSTRDPRCGPVRLGSLKSNVGHTQAAAGVVSVIKMILSLQHDQLPQTIHADEPTELVDWDNSGLRLLQQPEPWPRGDRPRRAGVSSFGISGTNAHVIVEEAPATGISEAVSPRAQLGGIPGSSVLIFSATSERALRIQAHRWAQWFETQPEADLPSVAAALATTRRPLRARAAIHARTAAEAAAALSSLAAGDPGDDVITGVAAERGRTAFVFPGAGSQWPDMGRVLLEQSEVFRATVDACDAAFEPHLGWSIRALLSGTDHSDEFFERMDVVQPALFTVCLGLAAVWRSLGIEPSAVVGSSQGELAAAVVAGALSLDDAVLIVRTRSEALQRECSGRGAMAVIGLPAGQVSALIETYQDRLSVAVVNSHGSTVVAGEPAAIDELLEETEQPGVFSSKIAVSAAGHSSQVDPILPGLRSAIAGVSPTASSIAFYSTVAGRLVDGTSLDAEYWCSNLREPVRLDLAVDRLIEAGHDVFVEVSAHPLLTMPLSEAVAATAGVVVGTLRRDHGDLAHVWRSLAELWCHGVDVSWFELMETPSPRELPELPTYAFSRDRYWYGGPTAVSTGTLSVPGDSDPAGTPRTAWIGLPDHERLRFLTQKVSVLAAAVIGAADPVPADRRLADLGLDSIMAVRLRNRLSTLTGVPVPANIAFLHPTPAALASWLQEQVGAGEGTAKDPELRRMRGRTVFPLTEGQRRLWFLEQLEPGSNEYNALVRLSVTNGLDIETLKRALHWLTRQHEALRTRLDLRDGELVQDVQENPPVECRQVGRPELSAAESEPFPVRGGALLRCLVAEDDAGSVTVSLVFHHAIIDGWSIAVLLPQLWSAYASVVNGEDLVDLPPRHQLGDFAAWESRAIESGHFAADVAWIADQLQGMPSPELPDVGGATSGWVSFGVAATTREAFETMATDAGVTPFAAYAAAFSILLSRYTGQDDFAIGTLWANRQLAGLEDTVGYFVNTLPLRCDLTQDVGFDEFLIRTSERTHELLQRQGVPLTEVIQNLRDRRQDDGTPLFRALFNYRSQELPQIGGSWQLAEDVSIAGLVHDAAKAELGLALAPSGGGLKAEIEFGPGILDRDLAAQLGRAFGVLLADLAAHPQRSIHQADALSAPDVMWLEEHRGTCAPAAVQPGPTALELILDQATQTPTAVALVDPTHELTYADVITRARRLSTALRLHDVGPGDLVGVCLPRTADLAVAVIGVWLTGAAYLPLDPSYPTARTKHVLQDSAVEVVVTDARTCGSVGTEAKQIRIDDVDEFEPGELGAPEPDQLAYAIYTSGSTGLPKGVLVEQRQLANFCQAMNAVIPDRADGDTWVALTTLGFDISVVELVWTLTRGFRVVVADPKQANWSALHVHRPTHLQCTPSLAKMLLADPDGRALLAGLRHMLVGGEALDRAVASRLSAIVPGTVTNMYGPTETTIWSSAWTVGEGPVSLGSPLLNNTLYVLDAHGRRVPPGVRGELFIGGAGVVRGYHARPDLTAERFTQNPFEPGRLYRTGDMVRYRTDGSLEFCGRTDTQVKLRGNRIELGEIETVCAQLPSVADCAAVIAEDDLYLFWTVASGHVADPEPLTSHLRRNVPEAMVPSHVIDLDELPSTPNGKTDRNGLARDAASTAGAASSGDRPAPSGDTDDVIQLLTRIWADTLSRQDIDPDAGLFDLGATSMTMLRAHQRICAELGREFPLAAMFRFPTVRRLANHLRGGDAEPSSAPTVEREQVAVAVVGIACRFPGAQNLDEFWANLQDGVESIRTFTDDELESAGVPEGMRHDPDLVRSRAVLDRPDLFDASFFGYSDAEATAMDPQHRLLLECAWEAFEDAGIAPRDFPGKVAVYAGAGYGGYPVAEAEDLPSFYRSMTGTRSDYLATRIAHRLNLRGPAITVQTACSTGLVATHLAREAVARGEADLAIVGASSVTTPIVQAFRYQEGMIASADGSCRAFDVAADGIVFGSGVGVLVLRRLDDALAAGDRIYGVLTGTAVNNDGDDKVGFTAPSVGGQAEVIRDAHAHAQIRPGQIGMIEAHGTATALGDAIEVQALQDVFGIDSRDQPCALGSVKTNIGHADATAGIAGLIKALLSVHHGKLVPSLHFSAANPALGLDPALFEVTTSGRDWTSPDLRRAGVSSFGIGGTNAHVVVEQAQPREETAGPDVSDGRLPLVISATSQAGLQAQARRWADWLAAAQDQSTLAQVARTASRRSPLEHRAAVFAESMSDAIEGLRALADGRPHPHVVSGLARPVDQVVFVYPGQGGQWDEMALGLMDRDESFTSAVMECDAALAPHTGWSVADHLRGEAGLTTDGLDVVQVAQFTMYVALTRMWQALGVEPDAVVGHSQGEIAAAVSAGALTLQDGARLVALRSRALATVAGNGRMAFVELPVAEVSERIADLGDRVVVAGVNTAASTVVAGDPEAITQLLFDLDAGDVVCGLLDAPVASHTRAMDALLVDLRRNLGTIRATTGQIPFVSTVTGDWLDGESLDADYWCRNLREPVRFDLAQDRLRRVGASLFVEVSPHPTMAMPLVEGGPGVVVGTLSRGNGTRAKVFRSLAEAWVQGYLVRWEQAMGQVGSGRLADLPTYAFQRHSYWLESSAPTRPVNDDTFWRSVGRGDVDTVLNLVGGQEDERDAMTEAVSVLARWRRQDSHHDQVADWLYEQAWTQLHDDDHDDLAPLPARGTWALFSEGGPEVEAVTEALRTAGAIVVHISASDDSSQIFADLQTVGDLTRIVTFSSLSDEPDKAGLTRGFRTTLALAKAVQSAGLETPVWALTRGAMDVDAVPAEIHPWAGLVVGLGRVLAAEDPCRWGGIVDVAPETGASWASDVVAALTGSDDEDEIAVRVGRRYGRRLRRLAVSAKYEPWMTSGTALITGGQGALGRHLAAWLAQHGAERIVLASRTGTPTADLVTWAAAMPVEIELASCDVAEADQVTALVKRLDHDGPPLRYVAHLAGVSCPDALVRLDAARAADEIGAKATGGWNLHVALGDRKLDAFLLYSSGAYLWGGAGLAAYAAANAVLDGIARLRRHQGLTATTIHWGGWRDGGMVTAEADAMASSRGLHSMHPGQALAALDRVMGAGVVDAGVADIDWSLFAPTFSALRPRPLISTIPDAVEIVAVPDGAAPSADWPAELQAMPEQRRALAVTDLVMQEAQAVLGDATKRLSAQEPLRQSGFDSLMAVTLRTRLARRVGATLTTAAVMRHGSCEGIAGYLLDQLFPDSRDTTDQVRSGQDKVPARSNGSWLTALRAVPQPRARVVCSAGMGGTTGMFAAMARYLPPDVEVLGVQLPGREDRTHEAPVTDMMALADHVAAAMADYTDVPVLWFGHSQGSWLSWELAHRWSGRPGVPAHALLVACALPPTEDVPRELQVLTESLTGVESGTLAEAADTLRYILPAQVVENEELLGDYLPRLRVDADLAKNHQQVLEGTCRAPLPIPLVAVAGQEDPVITADLMQTWRNHSALSFELRSIAGTHAAPLDNPRAMAEEIERALATLTRDPDPLSLDQELATLTPDSAPPTPDQEVEHA